MRECDQVRASHFLGTDFKHIIVVCVSSDATQQPPCIDFSTNWRSVFLDSLTDTSQDHSFISMTSAFSRSSFSSVLDAKSWVDLLNREELQIFHIIETLYGVLGSVALLEYPRAELAKEAAEGVYWLSENKDTKHLLEMQVFPPLHPSICHFKI